MFIGKSREEALSQAKANAARNGSTWVAFQYLQSWYVEPQVTGPDEVSYVITSDGQVSASTRVC